MTWASPPSVAAAEGLRLHLAAAFLLQQFAELLRADAMRMIDVLDESDLEVVRLGVLRQSRTGCEQRPGDKEAGQGSLDGHVHQAFPRRSVRFWISKSVLAIPACRFLVFLLM